ncbi:MAG: ribosomal RNA small subunit methyltransferase A [Parcubacteria group bacterium]|nr:ribosomal RNA small subunit methyltransferase A [Parcubacteria group bacterium]
MEAKKSLGQNFLKNESIARDLVRAAGVGPEDTVLEVGPGKGMITKILLEKALRVVAVEKDEALAAELAQTFSEEVGNGKLTVVSADILLFDPKNYNLGAGSYKLVGSIPYYITGFFLRRFLSIDPQPETIALIIQKEVARRIIGGGRESLLSISVKVYGEPRYVKTIRAGSFDPTPKVDSAILSIENISRGAFDTTSEDRFFTVLRAGFAHPRKKLLGNLAHTGIDKNAFEKASVNVNARAENLSVDEWKRLAQTISDL